jgi:hypothetical protein
MSYSRFKPSYFSKKKSAAWNSLNQLLLKWTEIYNTSAVFGNGNPKRVWCCNFKKPNTSFKLEYISCNLLRIIKCWNLVNIERWTTRQQNNNWKIILVFTKNKIMIFNIF